MNSNQALSLIRWLANALSGGIIAWSAQRSDATKGLAAYLAQLVTGPDVIAGGVLGLTWLWGHLTHRTASATDAAGNPINRTSIYAVLGIGVLAFGLTGCSITTQHTTINTPAVYNVAKDATGAWSTNLVSAASVTTSDKKERLWLPEGYALLVEDDMWGIDLEMTSPSSQLPNIKSGIHHGSMRWLPTSTNQLYAASMSASGTIDNKAVPFLMAAQGQFTAGNAHVANATSTNGISADAGAIVPGTPNTQHP
jgi:hypothetical protein